MKLKASPGNPLEWMVLKMNLASTQLLNCLVDSGNAFMADHGGTETRKTG